MIVKGTHYPCMAQVFMVKDAERLHQGPQMEHAALIISHFRLYLQGVGYI